MALHAIPIVNHVIKLPLYMYMDSNSRYCSNFGSLWSGIYQNNVLARAFK